MRAWLAASAVLAITSPVMAAPKGAAAKAAFERGVVAYQKGDFAVATEALGTSFKLENDVETLFAWAQAELQRENCEKANELFDKLLSFDFPAENKAVIRSKIDECKVILAAKAPAEPPPAEPVAPPPPVEPPKPLPQPRSAEGSPWWKDPIGDGLVGAGVIGLAAGAYFLVSASNAEAKSLESYNLYEENNDRAESQGRIGVIATIAGGALIAGGVIRYMTRGGGKERTAVTGWLTPGGDGGGIVAAGRF